MLYIIYIRYYVLYIYIYIYAMHPNLTEARWAQNICNHENNAPVVVITGYHHSGFVATHTPGLHELPQSHCGANRKGTLFS